jgi:hypothetical protein
MYISSVANAGPRNAESVRVNDLIPPAIQTNAQLLVSFLEKYYEHLNSEGLPSYEIQSISGLHDLDLVSEKYLSQIEALIGKSIPSSTVLDKFELYKIVLEYYNTRGSEDSIHLFFKIFLNKVVELSYPKEVLFKLSEGDWDNDAQEYLDHKSFASDIYKLFDGHYYQDYSYVIRSDIDSSLWRDDYLGFVHPAGLKLFTAIVIEILALNRWDEYIDYSSEGLEDPDLWLNKLVPPSRYDATSLGFHTPKYQPGYIRDQFFRFVFKYLFDHNDEGLLRQVIINFKFLFLSPSFRDTLVREQYQISEKFIDPTEIGCGFLSKTIEDAEALYSRTNTCKILNIGSFITTTNIFETSYLDDAGLVDSGDYLISYLDDAPQSPPVGWEQSSFEPII